MTVILKELDAISANSDDFHKIEEQPSGEITEYIELPA